jgi:hypothetical protein
MTLWHVRARPTKSSGNEAFDDAARAALMELLGVASDVSSIYSIE